MRIPGWSERRRTPVGLTEVQLLGMQVLGETLEAEREAALRARFRPEDPDAVSPQFFTMDGLLFDTVVAPGDTGEADTDDPLAN